MKQNWPVMQELMLDASDDDSHCCVMTQFQCTSMMLDWFLQLFSSFLVADAFLLASSLSQCWSNVMSPVKD